MIEAWIESYQLSSQEEMLNAQREIIQEVALSGLARANFFDIACFYGGTALRVFYGLDRYSEDLDFSLLAKDPDFNWLHYIPFVKKEFDMLGLSAKMEVIVKKVNSPIESAFLKDNTVWSNLDISFKSIIGNGAKLKIKIEVDTMPPLGFSTEPKLLLRPYSQYITCMVKEDLFAGKMHALLFRQWKNNVKGRDWYDMIWYITQGIPLNLNHLTIRSRESGFWKKEGNMTKENVLELYQQRVENLNIEVAVNDIKRFIKDKSKIQIWSKQYFLDIILHLKTL